MSNAEPTRKIIVVHESAEGSVVYGFEAPEGYEAPQGSYDHELMSEIEEYSTKEADEKIRKINTIIRLLEIPIEFSDGDWLNIYDEGLPEFFKTFAADQLS